MSTSNPRPPLFELMLYQPEIPPNAGNIIRLSANTGCRLHLVRPLGFSLQDKRLQRAGLDYHAAVEIALHDDWSSCRMSLPNRRWFAITTRGERRYDEPSYRAGDVFAFGSETAGLPESIMAEFAPETRLRIPMLQGSRTLNLSNAAALVVYEAWRQLGFPGGA
jgi:tRNA (cytidine/uridine-2'-O-)-methyltransferase